MKIYFIYGDQDSGKTFTCRKLREKILEKNISEISHGTFKWDNDFYSGFNDGDKKLAVYSAGDSASMLRDALNFGLDNKCDILITAIRTNIKYKKPIHECLTQGKDDFEWITLPSSETDEEREANEDKLAQKLLELIS